MAGGVDAAEQIDMVDVDQLYRQHERQLRRTLRRCGAAPDDVDDQLHEVFARLIASSPSRGAVMSWKALLNRIAHSVGIDASRRRLARAGAMHDPLDAVAEFAGAELPLDEGRAHAELVHVLRRELLALDPRLRQILILARMEELSHREIGERLGLDTVIVSRQLAKAIAQLARRMAVYRT